MTDRPTAHIGNHSGLLRQVPPRRTDQGGVDAIVVPSARTAPYLREAAGLAMELNCTLLVLCSKRAERAKVLRDIEDHAIVADVIAVDMPPWMSSLPSFRASELLRDTPFWPRTDVSLKRNLALLLARAVGWERTVFLDDDIRVDDPTDLRRAAALLDTHDAVGLEIVGCLDNSVVCHAIRDTGGDQGSFLGAGALAVATGRVDGFFPEVYNEDWFFLLKGDDGLRPVARMGTATQYDYDPYANPERARREEFGDVLAEGLFALLDQGGRMHDADRAYWKDFLAARRRLINGLLGDARGSDRRDRDRIVASLTAALGRSLLIAPELCVAFLAAWEDDKNGWSERWRAVDGPISAEEAIGRFGLTKRTTIRFNRTGEMPREPHLRTARRRLNTPAHRTVRLPNSGASRTTPMASAGTITTSAVLNPAQWPSNPMVGGPANPEA
ncbi:hypothetical protein AB0J82_31160 [Asanoa sp. NPDC049518]|uniref:hypothetical protein n=1 Tax=unclassified Asanoa TaxID=2685164 RepID=UPI003436336E